MHASKCVLQLATVNNRKQNIRIYIRAVLWSAENGNNSRFTLHTIQSIVCLHCGNSKFIWSLFFLMEIQVKMMFRTILCFLCIVCVTFAWNLATVDDSGLNFVTNNNDYVVLHVSVFYVRSFLVIQNRRNSSEKNPITLIESTWPENLLPIQPRVFPNDLSHAKTICDCNGIIQSIYTAIDRNGMLWLIDNGSIYCPPKLIIYNLLKLNSEV